ncbi:hypothetical protein ACLOJK_003085, partial [Asimina triloba]
VLLSPMEEKKSASIIDSFSLEIGACIGMSLTSASLKFFAEGKTPRKLLPTYKQLKDLDLCVNFTSSIQLAAACCLIASGPHLQNLSFR